jgi:hypothetical protein
MSVLTASGVGAVVGAVVNGLLAEVPRAARQERNAKMSTVEKYGLPLPGEGCSANLSEACEGPHTAHTANRCWLGRLPRIRPFTRGHQEWRIEGHKS